MHLPVGNPALFMLYKRIWRIECGNRKTSRVLQNKIKTGLLGLNPEYTSFSFLNHYPKYILKKENCVRIAFVCLSHMKKIFLAFRRWELNQRIKRSNHAFCFVLILTYPPTTMCSYAFNSLKLCFVLQACDSIFPQ